MDQYSASALIIIVLWLFYYSWTHYARVKDVKAQLTSTLLEITTDTYASDSKIDGGQTWIELSNNTTRILSRKNDTEEELVIHLFFANAERSGSNSTRLIRNTTLKRRTRIHYQRTNRLSGVLLYNVSGATNAHALHALFDEILVHTHARRHTAS